LLLFGNGKTKILMSASSFETIQSVKSEKTRFTAKCAADGCPWRIHAAKLPDVPTVNIHTINDTHNCSGISHLGHKQASVQWVAIRQVTLEPHVRLQFDGLDYGCRLGSVCEKLACVCVKSTPSYFGPLFLRSLGYVVSLFIF
jgi:MuDR family transposase